MNADPTAPIFAPEPHVPMVELFRQTLSFRGREDNASTDDLTAKAESTLTAVLEAEPKSLTDVMIVLASMRLAVEDLEGYEDPDLEAERAKTQDRILAAIGNIGRFLATHPGVKLATEIEYNAAYIACGALEEPDADDLTVSTIEEMNARLAIARAELSHEDLAQ